MGKAETEQADVCLIRQEHVSSNEIWQIQKQFPYINKFQSFYKNIYSDACSKQHNFMPDMYKDPNNIELDPGCKVPQSDFLIQDLAWFKKQAETNYQGFQKAFEALIYSGPVTQFPTEKLFEKIVETQPNEYSQLEFQEICDFSKEYGLEVNLSSLIKANRNFATSLQPYTNNFAANMFDLRRAGWNVLDWLHLNVTETVFSSKENIQMTRSNQAEDHLQLGKEIEKRIFEERQVFNRMAISFLKDYLNGDVKLSDVGQARFTKEYLKAKISLNQSLDGHLVKTLCSLEAS